MISQARANGARHLGGAIASGTGDFLIASTTAAGEQACGVTTIAAPLMPSPATSARNFTGATTNQTRHFLRAMTFGAF